MFLQILSKVLDMSPFHFGVRLAVLASKKEIMDLESWLSTQLVSNKDVFYEVSAFVVFKSLPMDSGVQSKKYKKIKAIVNRKCLVRKKKKISFKYLIGLILKPTILAACLLCTLIIVIPQSGLLYIAALNYVYASRNASSF